jgi:CBS domain containing-hemolysin-like protein
MGLLILFLVLTIVISFVCSLMEATLLSSSLPYLMKEKENGSKTASLIIEYKESINKPLSAILTLNTVANTFGAAGVGAQAVAVFGEVYFGIISAVLTLAVLIISEIIPKTIGANYWKEIIMPAGRVIQVIVVLSFPLVILSRVVTRVFERGDEHKTVSRDELSAMARLGVSEGVLDEQESRTIHNIVHLSGKKIGELMTPRTVAFRISEKTTVGMLFTNPECSRFSRIPIYAESPDFITGYVLRFDVLEKIASGKSTTLLSEIKRDVMVVFENFGVQDVFLNLVQKKEHMAVVVDEYGALAGVVTLEDIMEALLGLEIVDEKDSFTDLQIEARDKWEKKSSTIDYSGNVYEKSDEEDPE